MTEEGNKQPLRKIAKAFEELAKTVNTQDPDDLKLAPFCHACSLVSPLFTCLGISFKFALMDYTAKLKDLEEASNHFPTLQAMIDHDVQENIAQKYWSYTTKLLRVKRAIDLVKVFYEKILDTEGDSLKDAGSEAYSQVFGPYHVWAIRKAVAIGMLTLPSKSQMLREVNEDEDSYITYLQSYIISADAVVGYIEKLYLSGELGIDW